MRKWPARYGSHPNVIYEICNEPNGKDVTWPVIKSYAQFIIPAIRAISSNSVIIVGTDTWSQGVRAAAASPLDFPNVMYALHFYTGSHKAKLRDNATWALAHGLPIFVTEWGLTDYSGKGPRYFDEAEKWAGWMNAHGISWTAFSFSNCDEGSASLKPVASMAGPWRDSDLTPSGAWMKAKNLGQLNVFRNHRMRLLRHLASLLGLGDRFVDAQTSLLASLAPAVQSFVPIREIRVSAVRVRMHCPAASWTPCKLAPAAGLHCPPASATQPAWSAIAPPPVDN